MLASIDDKPMEIRANQHNLMAQLAFSVGKYTLIDQWAFGANQHTLMDQWALDV